LNQIRARRLEVATSSISHSSSTLLVITSDGATLFDDEVDAPELERLLEVEFVVGCAGEA
jgi:hypothetical protein